jgi:hypothetical protein
MPVVVRGAHVVAGETVLRICIVNPLTTVDDIRAIVDSLSDDAAPTSTWRSTPAHHVTDSSADRPAMTDLPWPIS